MMKIFDKKRLRAYYYLTKPGIIQGNSMAALAGFLFASGRSIHWLLLAESLAGIALVIASACVYNNYIDRGIDAKMARTKRRALVKGSISGRSALIYATVLGTAGFGLLAYFTTVPTVALGIIGFVDYIVFYGISKRHSTLGTLVGSISGAVPPAAGYTAVTGHFDTAALLLFLVMVFWQMPHFFGIAMYRHDDYRDAGMPVLPVAKGMNTAKLQTLAYMAAFTVAVPLLTLLGYAGITYAVVSLLLGICWLWRGVRNLKTADDRQWGRHTFLFSLLVLTGWCAALGADPWLP
jgi:heme o synthase